MENPGRLKESSRFRSLRPILSVALLVSLCACSVVDAFGPRAVDYNQEAADSYSSQVLLNIVRAAYAEPLQFTDLSTVTGQASGSATTGTSLPFFGNRGTSSRLYTFSPGFTVTGGPSFNIANLHSQEFYQGIEGQIKLQTVAEFLDAGYDPLVVLPIFVSEFDSPNLIFKNNLESSNDFNAFYSFWLQMKSKGLEVEQVKSPTSVGPPLTSTQGCRSKIPGGADRCRGFIEQRRRFCYGTYVEKIRVGKERRPKSF